MADQDLLTVVIDALNASHKNRIYRERNQLSGEISKASPVFKSGMQEVLDRHIVATARLGNLIELLNSADIDGDEDPEKIVQSLLTLLREGRADATDDS